MISVDKRRCTFVVTVDSFQRRLSLSIAFVATQFSSTFVTAVDSFQERLWRLCRQLFSTSALPPRAAFLPAVHKERIVSSLVSVLGGQVDLLEHAHMPHEGDFTSLTPSNQSQRS